MGLNLGTRTIMNTACLKQGRRELVQCPGEKMFGLLPPPSPPPPSLPPSIKRRKAKNLYTKSERLTLGCRVTWDWCERVHWCIRQLMILPRNTKTFTTHSGPMPPSGPPSPGNLYRLPPPPCLVGNVFL